MLPRRHCLGIILLGRRLDEDLMKAFEKLRVFWSKKEKDLLFHYPKGISTVSDARYLADIFSKEVLNELTERGYDVNTLKFSIEPQRGNQKFSSARERGEVSQ